MAQVPSLNDQAVVIKQSPYVPAGSLQNEEAVLRTEPQNPDPQAVNTVVAAILESTERAIRRGEPELAQLLMGLVMVYLPFIDQQKILYSHLWVRAAVIQARLVPLH
jgi:hypothetical protein